MYIPSTIYDSNNIPVMWSNNHDFKDESSSFPKYKELFLLVFTEPWMALSHINSQKMKEKIKMDANISLINNQNALDFLLLVGNGEKITRIIINPCDLTNEPHERFFSLLPLKKVTDIDSFVKVISNAEICPTCYNKKSFTQNINKKEIITCVKYSDT